MPASRVDGFPSVGLPSTIFGGPDVVQHAAARVAPGLALEPTGRAAKLAHDRGREVVETLTAGGRARHEEERRGRIHHGVADVPRDRARTLLDGEREAREAGDLGT
jgi:hypothetical protein